MAKRYLLKSFILLLFLTVVSGNTYAQTINYKTYSVFLYSFSKYIEWPVEARQGEFIIAVIGNSKLAQELQTGVTGRKAGTQVIKVIEVKNISELAGVNMVFVGDLKSGVTDDIVKEFKGKPLLIVTERDNLVKKGAGVSFIIAEDNSLKFQMNEQILAEHNLKASAAILAMSYKGI